MLDNVTILDVNEETYFAAIELGEDFKTEPNDSLAIDIMRQKDISEIYSFDKHFDKVDSIIRLPIT